MRKRTSGKFSLRARIVLFASTAFALSGAIAAETGRYSPPSLDGYKLDRVKHIDKDQKRDGNAETLVEIFAKDGKYILRYTTRGKQWAWGVIGNVEGGPDDAVNNFALRDSNGDGLYDERYVGEEEFFLPAWIRQLQQVRQSTNPNAKLAAVTLTF